MKLVIDISDWRYKSICKGIEATKRCGVVGPDPVIHEAIYKGTPLPKGHGDLIDRKELTKYPPIWMEDKRKTGEDDAVILLSDILKAEPIIKADKAESEE